MTRAPDDQDSGRHTRRSWPRAFIRPLHPDLSLASRHIRQLAPASKSLSAVQFVPASDHLLNVVPENDGLGISGSLNHRFNKGSSSESGTAFHNGVFEIIVPRPNVRVPRPCHPAEYRLMLITVPRPQSRAPDHPICRTASRRNRSTDLLRFTRLRFALASNYTRLLALASMNRVS